MKFLFLCNLVGVLGGAKWGDHSLGGVDVHKALCAKKSVARLSTLENLLYFTVPYALLNYVASHSALLRSQVCNVDFEG